jgi:hypothetical protein
VAIEVATGAARGGCRCSEEWPSPQKNNIVKTTAARPAVRVEAVAGGPGMAGHVFTLLSPVETF